ncbi:Trk-type K+ transport system membrane component [Chryseobacterium jejuense]|nr:Trk-type K+ transport system membrane component [Chryseobacterium jejuense]
MIYFFLFFIVIVFGGISYLIMRLCNQWTRNHKYEVLFNTLIFIGSFLLISFLSLYIFISNLDFSR